MKIEYSLHAWKRIGKRKLIKVWVEEAIRFPDKLERLGKKHYVTKRLNGVVLQVVYVKEKYIKIITLYLRR